MKAQFLVSFRDGSRKIITTPYNADDEQHQDAAFDYVYDYYPEAVYVELI